MYKEIAMWVLAAMSLALLVFCGCVDFTDKVGHRCNYDNGTVWNCSADHCQCYDKCVLASLSGSAGSTSGVWYNVEQCMHAMCVRQGYYKVCR